MTRAVVLGVDSSTQSTKVLAVDAESGAAAGEGRAPHTGLDVQNPLDWWAALRDAIRAAVASDMDVKGIAVAGQQHGLVTLDAAGHIVRPAPLWNNTDAAPDAERLNAAADFAQEVGTRLVASITIAKLAHLARTDPDDLARTAAVGLPHDYLNFRLTGRLATDRGDASGSGWWSPREARERRDLLALALGSAAAERLKLPDVLAPEETVGPLTADAAAELGLPAGIPVAPGTGDNMATALGVGATTGEIVVSLGTSGVAFAVTGFPTADETGEVAGFADAAGRFLPLACMLNCTRVVDTIAAMLGIDRLAALDRAAETAPGAHGLLLMPYFGGERTPNLPAATGSLAGMTPLNLTPDLLVRAAVDGVAAGIAFCLEALGRLGIAAPGLTLVGGGSQHAAWRQAIADATGLPVTVRGGGEHAARGAAMQAAAVALGKPLLEIVQDWRPPAIAEAAPRPGMQPAFALDERRRIIARERAASHG